MQQYTEPKEKDLKLFSVFTGIFVAVLVLVGPLASKFIAIGPWVITGATLVFPITFIFNDILTEVYGYQRSRRIIWTGMGCQVFAAFMFFLVGIWPAASFWNNQEAYDPIFGRDIAQLFSGHSDKSHVVHVEIHGYTFFVRTAIVSIPIR